MRGEIIKLPVLRTLCNCMYIKKSHGFCVVSLDTSLSLLYPSKNEKVPYSAASGSLEIMHNIQDSNAIFLRPQQFNVIYGD